jgi:hypothetical protein
LSSTIGDVYIYQIEFTNTSELGVYTIKALVYDRSSNFNTTNTTFEIFPTIIFQGYSKDEEDINKPVIAVNFTFYDNVTEEFLNLTILSNETTGYYNETIESRGYDINIEVFNDTVYINDTLINSDVTDPVIFGDIPTSRIGIGALTGLYINNSLNFSKMKIFIDYSSFTGLDANNLALYECTAFILLSGCNGTWDRINATVINKTLEKASMITTNKTSALALGQYICGNNICEETYGESESLCPQDCAPSVGGGEGAGGAGAGGGAGGISLPTTPSGANVTGEIPNITIPELEFVPMEIKSTLLYITLQPGEKEIHSLELTNNLENNITSEITVEGLAWEFIKLEKTSITVPAKSTETIKIEVYALPSTAPGTYTGDILVTSANMTHRTPITIKVEIPEEPLLDVIVEALSKVISAGDPLKIRVTIKNMGETATVEDITIKYIVKSLRNETIITQDEETLAVDDTLSYTKSILIPNGTEPDRYVIELNASYWNDRKFATAADAFDITFLPEYLVFLHGLLLHWLTYVILFALVPGVYLSRKIYKNYKLKRARKARYIFPVDYKKLPQTGPQSILVGKIAETNNKAYVDVKNLMMHSIAAGGTGSGKSVSAMVVAEELLKRKIPVIVFDPTAQWTGFINACKDKHMLDIYPQFGLKPSDARAFKTNIIVVDDPTMDVDVRNHMEPGEITVFVMSKLRTSEIDKFVRKTIESIFAVPWPESADLKLLIVYDEVHRLLPKYGGKGGYVALERGCREFRKWGIGLFLISQVLSDFKGAIRANIATEIQLRTKYVGDINRVKSKFGPDYASRVVRLTIGTGLCQNPEYNDGKPWFVAFRPLLHNTQRLTEEEIASYVKVKNLIGNLEKKIEALKGRGVNTYDIELELNMAKEKMKAGLFKMAETYMESVSARIKSLGG